MYDAAGRGCHDGLKGISQTEGQVFFIIRLPHHAEDVIFSLSALIILFLLTAFPFIMYFSCAWFSPVGVCLCHRVQLCD